MGGRTYTDEALRLAVATSHSWRGVLRALDLKATSSAALRSVRSQADALGLGHTHFTGSRRWTDDELAAAVAASRSWQQVADHLGLSGGSSSTALKGHAARLGLDSDHMGRARPATAGVALEPRLHNLPRAGSLMAASWLSMCGFDVAWPLEPCRYDLIASREGLSLRIQVKTTRTRRARSWVVSLHSTSRKESVYDPDDIDHFFIIDADLEFYLVPIAVVGGLQLINLSAYQQFRLDRQFYGAT